MTKHIGIFEAKTHFSTLVDEVEKGGEIVITRHGKPVARLTAPEQRVSPELAARRRKALDKFREIASRLQIGATQEEIKAAITEGRR